MSFDGSLGRGEPGIAMIAARSSTPVVPVRLFGAREAMPRGGRWKPFRPIRVVFGKPIRFSGNPKNREDFQKFADEIMAAIAGLDWK